MKLDAFSITQKGGLEGVDIFITVFKAKDLVYRYMIDRWTMDNPGGYQRVLSERRLSDTRGSPLRYLVRDIGCFPTSILINIRGEIKFTKEKDLGWFSVGTLDTGDEKFWLIDGQHRIEALKKAIERNRDFEDYPVIASILKLPERFDEMLLFYYVNKRQRSVPTDLVYRHLQRMLWQKGPHWLEAFEGRRGVRVGYATEIVDILNQTPTSPWHERIQVIGESKHENHIVTDSQLIRAILVILKETFFSEMPVSDFAKHLIDYWNAIYQLYPECFVDSSAYSLLGTPGIQVMHRLFPHIYARCIREDKMGEYGMEEHLEKLHMKTPKHFSPDFVRPIDSEFWSKSHGPLVAISSGSQNIEALYQGLVEKIRLAEES
ncbi:MAG: DGQHR domain-containing protein [Candidatus Bathyarchaeota archaeon]|nr:DGQHR domain-containing protein [Candidatus Bathyarchaeota archaeon]